jgi:phage tail sheath protein FI
MENKRVFVSPGFYSSERDLTFVTNNVGVTTLGLVGETLKGPAFQNIFVSNKAELKSFFGGQNSKKNKFGALQYELPYIANAYLENSNQLYVTRVLGLDGYEHGDAYGITVDGVVVAVLRSTASYKDVGTSGEYIEYDTLGVTISDATPVIGSDFTIEVSYDNNGAQEIKEHTVSLDKTKKNYIVRKLSDNHEDTKYGIYVDEIYPNYIDSVLADTGAPGVVAIQMGSNSESYNFRTPYKAAYTPYIVSEVIDNTVNRLFRFETISDGESANTDIKVSITNIKPDAKEFDVEVRNFYDNDSKPSIVERFSKCNMDPTSDNYIGKRIGTTDGDFAAISSYVLVDDVNSAVSDSYPAGFEGYVVNGEFTYPQLSYNTTYSQFENIRKKYLGVSSKTDVSILKFKGVEASGVIKGFHMDEDAAAITGKYQFQAGAHSFKNEAELINTTYEKVAARKFTVAFAGGFDGWNIHRGDRTNTDNFTIQKLDAAGTISQSNTSMYNARTMENGEAGLTTDYYAYLEAIRTFSNPEQVNINVFATPGIDLFNHPTLSELTIDMIESERGDSIYIATTPDTSEGDKMTPQDVSDRLSSDYDSNYTATYWPWIQKKDVENGGNVYLSPTCEVVKNLALTDNVAHPWFATAGFKFGKINAEKARLTVTQADREILYANRINPITTFAGSGIAIMGNKNLQVSETALNRLNVRRLLLRARKLISAVGVRLLFDQNDGDIRDAFLSKVNPILENIRKERGLENFRVELDPISSEGNDRNTLNGRIRIQPTDALEYINISFDVDQNGASFDDV